MGAAGVLGGRAGCSGRSGFEREPRLLGGGLQPRLCRRTPRGNVAFLRLGRLHLQKRFARGRSSGGSGGGLGLRDALHTRAQLGDRLSPVPPDPLSRGFWCNFGFRCRFRGVTGRGAALLGRQVGDAHGLTGTELGSLRQLVAPDGFRGLAHGWRGGRRVRAHPGLAAVLFHRPLPLGLDRVRGELLFLGEARLPGKCGGSRVALLLHALKLFVGGGRGPLSGGLSRRGPAPFWIRGRGVGGRGHRRRPGGEGRRLVRTALFDGDVRSLSFL